MPRTPPPAAMMSLLRYQMPLRDEPLLFAIYAIARLFF